MEETIKLEEKIKEVFKESMIEYAEKESKGDKNKKAMVVGVLTNFIVMSSFSEDLAGLLNEGTLEING